MAVRVFLVPGFFGFTNLGDFAYFSHFREVLSERLRAEGMDLRPLEILRHLPPDSPTMLVGLVSSRQRPGTAKGVMFIALEDETSLANLVVWRDTWLKYRRVLAQSRMLRVRGKVQRQGDAVSVLVEEAWPAWLSDELHAPSRDFR